ncbi:biopolymer transporter ExbD [Polynucleobacter paneuropaeus]|jgi:biopolymer transport protein ExbD|uniref:ExbD/TolR family protein n=1 Tax=Polynucleobacter paneuropaeus TaxID=2527775 RepID=UPI000DBF0124|nr:biopolymer transporter ExbD [Polynucleobacter paneuropaeus]AWW44100.1 biopolymer transporter ExbD [Polynucleobacter paneuropaeus]MBT8526827.1 biopolymer transporter ExbD [Polynucleobacter paneuropaeus]MBT8527781.1 biopolymer transporter ExbD [Polynucleobacter paneuropaeus]MBT8529371.1 biopolymer transporter ExbD [Polynucleobacter paneuropaeus]MBT8533489.1 biopolymer transporter ExbD [Polynucleobacter paneuropaeus]
MQMNKNEGGMGSMAEINVTPLVDVMLVLLVVFILTAPLIVPQSMKVNLPKTQAVTLQEKNKKMELVIESSGALTLDGKQVSDKELERALSAASSNPEAALAIQADKGVPYGRVAEIMAISQGAGVVKLSFVTLAGGGAK